MDLALDDLIVAPATPPGRGALAVVRMSGPGAIAVATALAGRVSFVARRATRARLRLAAGLVEDGVVTTFVAPHSFTGQESVEFSIHGSPTVVEALLRRCVEAGARLAGPGEFSYRAYLNGRLDLLQAEAVADLVSATTPAQARVASAHLDGALSREIVQLGDALSELRIVLEASLDFPDEGYHFIDAAELTARLGAVRAGCERLLATADAGHRLHDGATVVIAGRPNAGKSSLFNALIGASRAIVTPVAGTTRDLLVEAIDIGGIPVRLVDTAGLRAADDQIEAEGIARASEAMAAADLVVFLVDATADEAELEAARTEWARLDERVPRLVVASKVDLLEGAPLLPAWCPPDAVAASSVRAGGLEALVAVMTARLASTPIEGTMLTRARHRALVEACATAVDRAATTAGQGGSEEYVLADVHAALSALGSLRGVETADDVLQAIFSTFCLGK